MGWRAAPVLTGQNLLVALAFVLFAWYFVGGYVNRRRALELTRQIRDAVRGIGDKPAIRWYGRSAFQVDVAQPRPPFAGFHLFCVLEPRDFALALLWTRLRGRRDQVHLQADLARPPSTRSAPDPKSYGIRGLTDVELGPERPHLRMTLRLAAGDADSLRRGVELAKCLAGERGA